MKPFKLTQTFLLLLAGICSLPSCAQQKFQHDRLITIWETKKDLKTTESVLYDSDDDLVFVSNINQNPWEKDGNGYISKLNLKGDIISAQWITSLSAPKGMGVHKGKLYITDINELVEIDIKKGIIIKKYQVEGAQKLNDITVDRAGNVYISDSGDNAIYVLKKDKVELFMKTKDLEGVNGLFAQGETLMAGLKNKVISIDVLTKQMKIYVDNTGGIDGLVPNGKGGFFISDWTGHVYEIKEGQKPVLLLDTTPVNCNAADIEFVKGQNILLVPTFFKDNVVAYQVKF